MTHHEFVLAKNSLPKQRALVEKLKRGTPEFVKEITKLIGLNITVHGHAWCMDVKGERAKMAKLVSKTLADFI